VTRAGATAIAVILDEARKRLGMPPITLPGLTAVALAYY
jgi:hypothetical protein